jgi:hypothetical protein
MTTEELLPDKYREKASEYRKGTDTMDVWFDSGRILSSVVMLIIFCIESSIGGLSIWFSMRPFFCYVTLLTSQCTHIVIMLNTQIEFR